MVGFGVACWVAGYCAAWLVCLRSRNHCDGETVGWFSEVVYYLGECCARAGYAAAITCGVLLGLGAGLPLFVALGKAIRGMVP
jgi:hypothetical protein